MQRLERTTSGRSAAAAEVMTLERVGSIEDRLTLEPSIIGALRMEPSLRKLPPSVSVKIVAQLLDDISTPLEPPRLTVVSAHQLLKDYGASMVVCSFASLLSLAVVMIFSRMEWVTNEPSGDIAFNAFNFTLLCVSLSVSGVAFFLGVEFITTFGYQRFFDRKFFGIVLASAVLYIVVLFSMTIDGFDYWWYYVDILVVVPVYCVGAFFMGFLGSASDNVSRFQQFTTGIWYMMIEVCVSAAALIYGMALIPIYLTLSPIHQAVWRVTLHSFYFEVFMMIPVRWLVSRQLKSLSVLKSLPVVHAQAHISSIGRMMLAGFSDLWIAAITIVLVNVGKLLFRMTSPWRDSLFNKMFSRKVFSSEKEAEDDQAFKQFVRAISLHVDIIMETSCVVTGGVCLYLFLPHAEFFMLPFPNNGVPLTITLAVSSICIQLVVGAIFDCAALYCGARYLKMPVSETFEQMKAHSGPFFGFLIYGVATMGTMTTLFMACRVPRPMFCASNDICSCNFLVTPCSSS
eukprot:TRINITY_DN3428_c0_g1_i1.p1 TRINITY_DN3428_c0_g1~~TRINITY_DN3428_c0_g1_i1.p1  ORF type:complete len:515 (+),score=79.82 TRINITY_DN3428_c0_g1_i1:43-1587(+)